MMNEFDNKYSFENNEQNHIPAEENKPTESIRPAEESGEEYRPQENLRREEGTQNTEVRPTNSSTPYFRGYAQPDYTAQNHQREYPYRNQNGQNLQNPQQIQNNGYGQQGYQQNYQGYRPYQPQGYQPHSQQMGQGQISYTPTPEKKQKRKSSTGVIAVICAAAVILSGLSGFGGTLLANRMTEQGSTPTVNADSAGKPSDVKETVEIYRSVDEVATTSSTNGENLTYSQVAAIAKNSVVEIVTEFNVQSGWYQYVTQGAGSGVIISTDGYIITNTHVIADESTGIPSSQITVRLADGSEHPAKTIGYDADSDISIIKIEAENLVAAQSGDSDKLTVGEELVIVGNPLGELGGTVTNGIVSATEREILVNNVTMSLIQTNAAVNPGNSGGGMFNMQGQLVGIVNAKSSGSDIEGLGFAIPINEALNVSKQLLEYGYVRGKTMIGASFEQVSGSNYFFYYNIEPGLYVTSLSKGYNDTVLQVGDRVVAVNGETVSAVSDIKAIVTASSVGDKIKFQVERDGKLMEVEVECFERVPTPVTEEESIEFEGDGAETTPTWQDQVPATPSPFGSFSDLFPDIFGGH